MPSNLEMRVLRLEGLVQRLKADVDKLRDEVARLRQQRFAEQGGGGGGGGGAAGIFNATPAGSIAAGATSSETVTQSWDGASVGTKTIRNSNANSATTAGRKLILGKNPDSSYTIIGQDCT
jgi:hypothetical protein